MNKIHILVWLTLLGTSACVTNKKTSGTKSPIPASATAKAEYSKQLVSFFDAEKMRIIGDKKKALDLYSQFVLQYPHNATAHYNYARLQFQTRKDISGAEKSAQKAYNLDKHNRYFQEYYVELLEYSKKNKEAEALYNDLITRYPDQEEYYYKKAMLLIKNNESQKALQIFNDMEKRFGFNEELILQKKNIYRVLNQHDLAAAELNKLRAVDPSEVRYVIMMIDLYEDGGKIEKVNALLKELDTKFTTDPMAQVTLAQYYLDKKDQQKYNAYMQQVMKNKNLDVETKIALIIPSLRELESDSLKTNKEIVSMARSISLESPNNKDAVSLYADVLYYTEEYADALTEYKKYLSLHQSNYTIWNQVMSIYSDQQQWDSVIHYANESMIYFPNHPMPYFYSGVSYLQKKEAAKAVTPLLKSASLESENIRLQAQIFSTLGDAYHALQKYTLSDSSYEQALKLTPEDAGTLNNYAYYLSLRNTRLADAEKMSKRSLAIQPDSKSFLDTYGWILFQQGKTEEAKLWIEKAIQADGSEDGTLFEHMGDIYFKLKDPVKALEYWNKAVKAGENSPELLKKINDVR
ncbi:MAG: tetratricopeptide repeat protein [Chitinophagaceae bacterium]|nr:tetratricopeptide repeat protein [Chitinophagaceae bacterium]